MVKYSQLDEQEKLIEIFNKIGTTNKTLVDIGAYDGVTYSNTRHFIENGWNGFLFDSNEYNGIEKEFFTVKNVNDILNKYNIPHEFDLLSIDIDGNDYWIWKNIKNRPRVVIIEYNCGIDLLVPKTVKYNPNFIHALDTYYGASFAAMEKLGKENGYNVVYANKLNIIFVRNDIEFIPYKFELIHELNFPKCSDDKEWVKV